MTITTPTSARTTHASATGTPYADALRQQAARDTIRLNVPGHGADGSAAPELAGFFGEDLLRMDFTPLLHGLDLGPGNPLERAQELAAEAWGARRTWFLTNGASQANRIAALALGGYGHANQPVLVQRSAHSSFIDGIILAGLVPAFVGPTIDDRFGIAHGVSAASLRASLAAAADPKGVYVISPSYFGAVADVAELAEIAHAAGVPLIVDAAWGAHFGFHPSLPANPVELGADLVVSSTHKLGGSLSQSAMLHLAAGPFADALEPLVHRAFMVTQSTSMSSVHLASLDIARFALETGTDRLAVSIDAADRLRAGIRERGRFGIVSDSFDRFDDIVDHDPMRVSIDVRRGGLIGHAVRSELMVASGIYTEISTDACVVAFFGPGLDPDVGRVLDALHDIRPDATAPSAGQAESFSRRLPPVGELRVRPRDAWLAGSVTVTAADAVGRISTDSLAAYPPGIPNVLPGEVITAEAVDFLQQVAASPGGYVRGAADPAVATFRVTAD